MEQFAPVRDCDGCTLCCKVMAIAELEKPAGTWCTHCAAGQGCTIYAQRPESCRAFSCGYLRNRNLGPQWKPSEAKFVISHEAGGARITIYVDPQRPDAWKHEPFLGTFRAWAEVGVKHRGQVVVFVGRHAHVVLPDRVVDLGPVAHDELILTSMVRTPRGVRLEPFKANKDDPRAQRFLAEQRKS